MREIDIKLDGAVYLRHRRRPWQRRFVLHPEQAIDEEHLQPTPGHARRVRFVVPIRGVAGELSQRLRARDGHARPPLPILPLPPSPGSVLIS